MIQRSHFWVAISKKWDNYLEVISAPTPVMFIAVLYTVATLFKQPKRPSVDE